MAWTTPLTAVANAALTAAQWNASVRDNLNETATAKFTATGQYFVATAANAGAARAAKQDTYTGGGTDSTNSTTYTGLTGGAAVTLTTGTSAIVYINSFMQSNTAGGRSIVSFAVSGATTIAASDFRTISATSNAVNEVYTVGGAYLLDSTNAPLTPGSNTFTNQFKVTTGTSTFTTRSIAVLPF